MSTNFTLTRTECCSAGIFGRLTAEQDNVIAYTLEHAYDDGAGGWTPKIPEGEFTCIRGTHVLHNGVQFETFEISGVPGHSGLLFHAGNYDKDSEGCVLLGAARVGDMVTNSRATFAAFMQVNEGLDTFQLTVINGGSN